MKRNPFLDKAKTDKKLLKTIQAQLDFHGITKLKAKDLLSRMKK